MARSLEVPVFAYSVARSLGFNLEYQTLQAVARILPQSNASRLKRDPILERKIRESAMELLKADAHRIGEGIYPASVLRPENLLTHFARIPKIILDGVGIYQRRAKGKTAQFEESAKEFLDGLPRYYQRNFHFQTNGYLSEKSAELYEHQVEMLFGGAADAMRRLIIEPMKKHFPDNPDGKGLTFLEIAAGTGRTTRFVRLAFPKARIVVSDLSEPYLRVASDRLRKFRKLDFVHADGAALPFKNEEFDAVYSVFLFHELPLEARKAVINDSTRVLRSGGFWGLVDSLQFVDAPEFAPLLDKFPKDFHEPFYRNYAETPMEDLISEVKLYRVKKNSGFFSKVVWATKKKLAKKVKP